MDSQKLLRETERAAGSDLLAQHDKLASGKSELLGWQERLVSAERDLQTLRDKNLRLEKDVERLNQRESIEAEIEVFRIKKVIAKYLEDVQKYQQSKSLLEEATQKYNRLAATLSPLIQEADDSKALAAKWKKKESDLELEFNAIGENDLSSVMENMEKAENSFSSLKRAIATARNKEVLRLEKIGNAEAELETIRKLKDVKSQQLIEKGYIEHDGSIPIRIPAIEQVTAKIQDCLAAHSHASTEYEAIQIEKNDFSKQYAKLSRIVDSKVRELQELDDVRSRRFHALREKGNDPGLQDAIMWLRNNQQSFSGRVSDPVILELELTDPQFAALIETCIPWVDQKAFVFALERDYRVFREHVIERQKRRVAIKCPSNTLAYYLAEKPTTEQLAKYGFEGVLIDLVKGHDTILSFLCEQHHFHKIPYSSKQLTPQQLSKAESIFPRFAVGTKPGEDSRRNRLDGPCGYLYVTNSAYGAYSTRMQYLKYPLFLTTSVDPEMKASLEREHAELHSQLVELRGSGDDITARERTLQHQIDTVKRERADLELERKGIMKTISDYRGFDAIIKNKQDIVNSTRRLPSYDVEIAKIHKQMVRENQSRAQDAEHFARLMTRFSAAFQKRNLAMLKRIHAETVHADLQHQINTAGEDSKSALEELQKVKDLSKEFKARARASHEVYVAARNKVQDQPEKLDLFEAENDEEDESLEYLDSKIYELEARSQLIAEVDPRIIQEFNARKIEIDNLETAARTRREAIDGLEAELATLHDTWKAKVQGILATISDSFSRSFESIGCAGEVCLKEDAVDYNKWGVEILVKFRQTETLQVLTAHRQSGGERSVSTMLYLIALQSLSKSPFRVVDEINQGMDPRNERLVHKLIVNAACVGNTSQYFLITPKLLPDLEYHEKMTVLCVFNGVWQPDKWDLVDKTGTDDSHDMKKEAKRARVSPE
ncbi:Structural maintenance of chromosomes protein 5 [Kappamyces sp. JEL0680]|nr:Structural maintenance of chromosomes protein 5 [Kappamyces sp. JEL0680]